ncbi:MAG: hypothetical protein FJ098_16245 [Deltaproteobacteria bacterium]|nr:hypothetical protein [Deltaproteobacteria bacterium]
MKSTGFPSIMLVILLFGCFSAPPPIPTAARRTGDDTRPVRNAEMAPRIPDLIPWEDGVVEVDGVDVPQDSEDPHACLEVHPTGLKFAGTKIGSITSLPLELISCGEGPLQLLGIRLSAETSTAFTLDMGSLPRLPTSEEPLVLEGGTSVTLDVRYAPLGEGQAGAVGNPLPVAGTILIESDAVPGLWEVPISVYDLDPVCPTPVIGIAEGEEVVPQTLLHLQGDQSFAASGSVARWEWSVEQPPGAQSVFIPSAAFPNPAFEVNVAGQYTFNLTVYDQQDIPSCSPASAQVLVLPCCGGFHVELTWLTPEDPCEWDEGPGAGADLDLHVLHPWAGGPDLDGDGLPDGWFDLSFDCFWFNAYPEWGSFDPSIDDNPGLDRDDTDGAGPENFNLHAPENVTYRVGVHSWDDHGWGPSFATVRVYLFSQLVFEVSDVLLSDGDLWEACTVEWPSGQVRIVLDSGGQYKITPTYESPFFAND